MRLSVSNQTEDGLLCRFGKRNGDQCILLVPPFSASAQFSPKCTYLLFSRCSLDATSKDFPGVIEDTSRVAVKLSLVSGKKWARVTPQGDSLWIMYRNRISRRRHSLVVFPYRDTSCFLASIPNSVPLSSLMLPGTHETMAFYGWPISQCQTQALEKQLHAGIRVLDIRLSIIDGRLIAYHGICSQVTPFADVLTTLYNFLTSPATASETVVVSVKQEDSDTQSFPKLVLNEIMVSPGGLEMWFLEHRIPCLGEVRGKAVMFRRFGGNWEEGTNGICPPIWPDSVKEGFEWECDGTLVRTQDWYSIPSFLSIPEKTARSMDMLVSPADSPTPILSISFLSAASIPFALPPVIARGFGWPKWGLGFEGVNDRVGKWLLDQLSSDEVNCQPGIPNGCLVSKGHVMLASGTEAVPRIRGWALMDYYSDPTDAQVVPLLVECNFRG